MGTPTARRGNPECYAQELGHCKGPVNREHYVSKAVLDLLVGIDDRTPASKRHIGVKGLTFLKDGERPVGIANLVGKVLCEHHNNQLSTLKIDDAGRDLVAAMLDMSDAAADPTASDEELIVDGDGLERWMLKTLCGVRHSGNFEMSAPSIKGEVPPLPWIENIFLGTRLPEHCGLYLLSAPEPVPIVADRWGLQLLPLFDDKGKVAGLRMWLLSFPLVLTMARPDRTWIDRAIYRPAAIRAIGSNKRIRFRWQDSKSDVVFIVECGSEGP